MTEFDQLKGNPANPRRMSKHDADSLKAAMLKFGDMSGIVFNRTTGHLVGGHMRTETFKRLGGQKNVIITTEWPEPKNAGTVAVGYIGYNDEYYAYREVVWDEVFESAANIAANRISGEWDLEKLADLNEFIKQQDAELLKLTGQSDEELKRLEQLGSAPEPENQPDDPRQNFNVKLTEDQSITVDQAISEISSRLTLGNAANDDLRGNALEAVCRAYLAGLNDNPTVEP